MHKCMCRGTISGDIYQQASIYRNDVRQYPTLQSLGLAPRPSHMQDVRLRHRQLVLTPDQTSEHKLDTRTSRHETCRQTRLHKSRSHSSTCPGTFDWLSSTTPISSRPYRQLESVGTRIITTSQPTTSVGLRPAPHGDDQPEPGTKYCPPLPPRVRVSLCNGRPPSLYSWSAAPFERPATPSSSAATTSRSAAATC